MVGEPRPDMTSDVRWVSKGGADKGDMNSRQNGWRTALFLGGLTHAGGSWWARRAREWPELVQWDGCAFISREAATGLSAAGCGGMIAFSILRGHR